VFVVFPGPPDSDHQTNALVILVVGVREGLKMRQTYGLLDC
jgi:hypothetical protein